MSSPLETVVLDSLGASPLTLQSGDPGGSVVYSLEDLDLGLAARRPNWIGGAGADGQLLPQDPPYDDAVMTATVQVFPATDSKDAAYAAVQALTLKLQECSASGPDGLACTYTAANSSNTYTFYVKLAEFDGAMPLTPTTPEGWMTLNNRPTVKLRLTRRPFFYLPEIGTVTDDFSSNTIANYTFDSGAAGNVAVTGGVLDAAANFATENRMIRTLGGYDGAGSFYDVQATVKATLGTTLSGFAAGLLLKRLDATHFIYVFIRDTGTVSQLVIFDNSTSATLATQALTRLTTSTSYWVRARVEGNAIYAEHWTSAPTATGTPAATTSYTLTGSDATQHGQGVAGKVGVVFTPQQTAAALDDFTIEPNVWRSVLPLLTGTLPGVPGDVRAECRIFLTDGSGNSRRFVELGIQSRFYQGLALQIDSASLVTTGFAGASTTRAGSYNTNTVRATLTTNEVTVCSTGSQGHIGTLRAWARVYATSTDVRVRMAWQDGSGPFRPNTYATPVAANAWVDLDLGVITVQQALAGTQQWVGRINALGDVGDTLDVDFVTLIPAGEGYAKALAPQTFETITAFTARDEFDQSAGNLTGKTLPVGGTWSNAGAAGDLAVEATGHTAQRTATNDTDLHSGRFEIAGTATFTDTLVQVDVESSLAGTSYGMGVHARYVDTNNWLIAAVRSGGSTSMGELSVSKKVAGSVTRLAAAYSLPFAISDATFYSIRLLADAAGRWFVWVWQTGGSVFAPSYGGVDTDLKTGGALASGKVGIYDAQGPVAATRSYDNFFVSVPQANEVLYSGRQAQIRSDSAFRQDSTGTYNGPLPTGLRGTYPTIPPAGAENRTTRLAARSLRNNPEEVSNANVTDSLSVQALITPRFLAPR